MSRRFPVHPHALRRLALCLSVAGCAGDAGTGVGSAPGAAAIRAVEITPSAVTLVLDSAGPETQQLTAVLRSAAGTVNGEVRWRTRQPGVATVSAAGLVTAIGPGQTVVEAEAQGNVGTAVVTVRRALAPAVARVDVTPATATLYPTQRTTLRVTAYDARGTLLTGRSAAYRSDAPAVATVTPEGIVTAVAPGSTRVTVTVEGASQSVPVVVRVPIVARLVADAGLPRVLSVAAGEEVEARSRPRAVALDSSGARVAGATVVFRARLGRMTLRDSVVETDSTGLAVLGGWRPDTVPVDSLVVEAEVRQAAPARIEFVGRAVAGAPARLSVLRGNGMRGRPGRPMVNLPAFLVQDRFGNPTMAAVHFDVPDGGSVAIRTDTTGRAGLPGLASPRRWVLAPRTGAQRLVARLDNGTTAQVVAEAGEEDSPFELILRAVDLPPEFLAILEDVVHRWRQVIRGPLSRERVTPSMTCGITGVPPVDTATTGLVVFVRVLDQPGAAGTGRPCLQRADGQLPLVAEVTLNTTLVQGVRSGTTAAEAATYLLMHEVGHALGMGTIPRWQQAVGIGADGRPHFLGPHAVAEYRRVAPRCTSVPMENAGHWRFDLLDGELLTLGSAEWNLSRLSVAALRDIGYAVDLSRAGDFLLSPLRRLPAGC